MYIYLKVERPVNVWKEEENTVRQGPVQFRSRRSKTERRELDETAKKKQKA